jgi:hypothetical protein
MPHAKSFGGTLFNPNGLRPPAVSLADPGPIRSSGERESRTFIVPQPRRRLETMYGKLVAQPTASNNDTCWRCFGALAIVIATGVSGIPNGVMAYLVAQRTQGNRTSA